MLTRRRALSNALAVGAGLAVGPAVGVMLTGCAHPPSVQPQPPAPSQTQATAPAQIITGTGSLRAHARACGLMTGAAITPRVLSTVPEYQRVVAEQYDILVGENAMKWITVRRVPDHFSFDQSDQLVEFAEEHRMKVRGHTLVWHNAIPDWFVKVVTPANAKQYLVDHITTLVGHYRGRIHSWDVVNEAILPGDGRPDGLRKSLWYDMLGPQYIEIAYRTAREADPHAKLTYNDYGVEYDTEEDEERRVAILALLRSMKTKKIPLDAVGIQSHIKAGNSAVIDKGLRAYMAAIHEMKLEIYLTELDVNEDDLPYNDVAMRDHTIAETYRSYLDVALSSPAVKAVLTWGVTDRYTWLNSGPTHHRKQPNRPQRSLPFDNDYKPTEAFFALRDSFDDSRFKRLKSSS